MTQPGNPLDPTRNTTGQPIPVSASADKTEEEWVGLLGSPTEVGDLGSFGGYRVIRLLGAGGMGAVFLAREDSLNRNVALKLMKPAIAGDPTSRERFDREAKAQAALNHEHVAVIYGVGEEKGVPWLAMELLEGESLDQLLARGWKPTVAQMLRLGIQIAEGLAVAHSKGIVHRDVKPSNLWIESTEGGRVKILDFGLARSAEENPSLTVAGSFLGTPHYVSPEQALGQPADHRSDLFSFGCVLYELGTGSRAFQGSTLQEVLSAVRQQHPMPPHQINQAIPQPLSEFVLRLLHKDPAKRPQSALEVVQALKGVQRQSALDPPSAVPVSPRSDSTVRIADPSDVSDSPTPRKAKKTIQIALVLLLLVLAGFGIRQWVIGTSPTRNDPVPSTNQGDKNRNVGVSGESVVTGPYRGHEKEVLCLDVSKQGYVVSGSSDGTLRFWNLKTGKEVMKHREEANFVYSDVAFSPQSKEILYCGYTQNDKHGSIVLWNPETDKANDLHRRLSTPPLRVSFFDDGRRILWADSNGETFRCRRDGGPLTSLLNRVRGGVKTYFSPQGLFLVRGDTWETVIYDTTLSRKVAGMRIFAVGALNPGTPSFAAITRDGKRVLVCMDKDHSRLLQVSNGKELQRFDGHRGYAMAMAFSGDEKRIVTGGVDKTVRVYDVKTGKQLCVFEGHTDDVTCVVFTPDGRHVVSGSKDKTVRVWRIPDEKGNQAKLPHDLQGDRAWNAHKGPISSLSASADGSLLLSHSEEDVAVKLWDLKSFQLKKELTKMNCNLVKLTAACISPDGKSAFIGGDFSGGFLETNYHLRRWDFAKPDLKHPGKYGWPVKAICFEPTGREVFVEFTNLGPRYRLDSSSFDSLTQIKRGPSGDAYALAAAQAENSLRLLVSDGNGAFLWDAVNDELLWKCPVKFNDAAIALSPDGKYVLTASREPKAHLWDVDRKKVTEPVRSLEGHTDNVLCVAFSPDGTLAATGSHDRAVRVWNVQTGKELVPPLKGHKDDVTSLLFLSNSRLASGSRDGEIHVWTLK